MCHVCPRRGVSHSLVGPGHAHVAWAASYTGRFSLPGRCRAAQPDRLARKAAKSLTAHINYALEFKKMELESRELPAQEGGSGGRQLGGLSLPIPPTYSIFNTAITAL